MVIESAEPGLRERKRLATHRAIQLAAIRIVDSGGLEGLTVDEIGRVADISPRTFFNYFPSKEAALIGEVPKLPAEEDVNAFIANERRESVLAGLSRLLASASEASAADRELTQLRRSVLQKYPQLFGMRIASMRVLEEALAEIVGKRLARDEPKLAKDPGGLHERARLVTMVAFAALRHAWACWADSATELDLTSRLQLSFSQLESLLSPTPTSTRPAPTNARPGPNK